MQHRQRFNTGRVLSDRPFDISQSDSVPWHTAEKFKRNSLMTSKSYNSVTGLLYLQYYYGSVIKYASFYLGELKLYIISVKDCRQLAPPLLPHRLSGSFVSLVVRGFVSLSFHFCHFFCLIILCLLVFFLFLLFGCL